MSFRLVCLTCSIAILTGVAPAQQGSAPSLSDLQLQTVPLRKPRNASDLAKLRAHYDTTVWADEVKSQNYERMIVDLWDRLLLQDDKYEVLATTPFNKLVVNTVRQTQKFDHGISVTRFTGPSSLITRSQWKSLLDGFRKQEFEIVGTELHHLEFQPPRDGPARSVISLVMFVKVQKAGDEERRLIVKGDLKVTWSAEMSGSPPQYVADVVNATGVRIMYRQGSPAFDVAMEIPFQIDDMGKSHPVAIRPVILHDLNGDQLPEVILPGYNEVFWNGGKWRFAKRRLCSHPSELVSAAVLADFTGDGVADLLCGLRNGYPQLYPGTSAGTFPTPPREIKIDAERLRKPVAMTAGDIDGDGDIDVFIGQAKEGYQTGEVPAPYFDANDSFPACLLLNDGGGNFRNAIKEAGLARKSRRRIHAATFVDLDADGDLDLLLTSDFSGNDLFLNDGRGMFTDVSESLEPRSYANGMSHTFGDYNLDGRIDFLTFGTSSTHARRLDSMDLGRPDFPEHNRQRAKMAYGNRMYLNMGRWGEGQSFTQAKFNDQVARTGWPAGCTTLDFDRDGDQDVFVVNGQTSGKTTRDYGVRFWCHDIYFRKNDRPNAAISDFFRKFRVLFRRHYSWHGFEHNALLMNLEGNGYTDVGFLMNCASVLDSRAAVSGDLDLDGHVDVIYEHIDVNRTQAVLHFMRNQSEDHHHWVGVHLIPNSACNSTQGAKVTVQLEDGQVLLQQRLSGHSASVQHADTLHFGMGKSAKIREIGVNWPNGVRSRLIAPSADRYHVLQPDAK